MNELTERIKDISEQEKAIIGKIVTFSHTLHLKPGGQLRTLVDALNYLAHERDQLCKDVSLLEKADAARQSGAITEIWVDAE